MLVERLFCCKGHFGEVYKVHSSVEPEQFYALKQLIMSSTGKTTLLKEIRAMMNCNHPNILKCRGYTLGTVFGIFIEIINLVFRQGPDNIYLKYTLLHCIVLH